MGQREIKERHRPETPHFFQLDTAKIRRYFQSPKLFSRIFCDFLYFFTHSIKKQQTKQDFSAQKIIFSLQKEKFSPHFFHVSQRSHPSPAPTHPGSTPTPAPTYPLHLPIPPLLQPAPSGAHARSPLTPAQSRRPVPRLPGRRTHSARPRTQAVSRKKEKSQKKRKFLSLDKERTKEINSIL